MSNERFQFRVNKDNIFPVISCLDTSTGILSQTVQASGEFSAPATMAWAMARFSRSEHNLEWHIGDISRKNVDAQAKLAETFVGYGHASVGDMAEVAVGLEGITFLDEAKIFNMSRVGAGQSRSSRYQAFDRTSKTTKAEIILGSKETDVDTQAKMDALVLLSITNYQRWFERCKEAYIRVYKPEWKDEDERKKVMSSLASRARDSARNFLVAGIQTTQGYITSAREWARIVKVLKEDRTNPEKLLGEQVEELLRPTQPVDGYNPEVDMLIRHTQPDGIHKRSLAKLSEFLKGDTTFKEVLSKRRTFAGLVEQGVRLIPEGTLLEDKIIAQYVATLHPDLPMGEALSWSANLDAETKLKIGRIIFTGYDNYNMPPVQSMVTGLSFEISTAVGEFRDLNRHRAWNIFNPLLEVSGDNFSGILNSGYTKPSYLNNPELSELARDYTLDMENYYAQLNEFMQGRDPRLLPYLLPLAHVTESVFHGNPSQEVYLTNLRVRPGGHINYREVAHQMADLFAASGPVYSTLGVRKPDYLSREEFFNRS